MVSMIIQGNKLGLLMFVICGLVAGAALVLKLPNVVGMVGVGLTLLLMDMIIRLRQRSSVPTNHNWLTTKEIGGYLYFIPAWVGGVVVIAINVINVL